MKICSNLINPKNNVRQEKQSGARPCIQKPNFKSVYLLKGLPLSFMGYVDVGKPEPFPSNQQLKVTLGVIDKVLYEQSVPTDKIKKIKKAYVQKLYKPTKEEINQLKTKLLNEKSDSGQERFTASHVERIINSYSSQTNDSLDRIISDKNDETGKLSFKPQSIVEIYEYAVRHPKATEDILASGYVLDYGKTKEKKGYFVGYNEDKVKEYIRLHKMGLVSDGCHNNKYTGFMFLTKDLEYTPEKALKTIHSSVCDKDSKKIFDKMIYKIMLGHLASPVREKLSLKQEQRITEIALQNKNNLKAVFILLSAGDDIQSLQGSNIVTLAEKINSGEIKFDGNKFSPENEIVNKINGWCQKQDYNKLLSKDNRDNNIYCFNSKTRKIDDRRRG